MASIDEEEDTLPEVGDTVTLNVSEGPEMVVSKITTADGVTECTCIWFEDQRQGDTPSSSWVLKKEVFPIEVLNVSEN
jgi:uncharacterized protein YodC (DUF2158 family)